MDSLKRAALHLVLVVFLGVVLGVTVVVALAVFAKEFMTDLRAHRDAAL